MTDQERIKQLEAQVKILQQWNDVLRSAVDSNTAAISEVARLFRQFVENNEVDCDPS